jgi:O-antigen/teichoic acid export membrane protein
MKLFLKSERFRRLSKEGFWVVLGQAIAILGSLVGIRILTGLMDPAVYGELALCITVATLISQAVLGPLGNGAIRFYAPAVEQGDFRGYLNAVRRLVLLSTGGIILVALFVLLGLLIVGCMKWVVILVVAFIFAIFNGYNSILSGIQNAARQRFVVAFHQGVEPWVRFLVAAGLVVGLGATSTVVMIGFSIAIIFVLASQLMFFRKIILENGSQVNQEKDWLKQIWDFSWPISIFGVFTWMQLASDRWALGIFSTMQDVGKYAALYQLGYCPISMVTGMVSQFFTPIFYQRAGDANNSQRNNSVNDLSWRLTFLGLGTTGVLFLVALLLHSQMFRVLVAAKYASVSYLLPWMLLAGGFFSVGQILAINLMSRMKIYGMAIAKIITALLGVLLNFAGAFWYGISGIVFANVFFSAVYLFWMVLLAGKIAVLPLVLEKDL